MRGSILSFPYTRRENWVVGLRTCLWMYNDNMDNCLQQFVNTGPFLRLPLRRLRFLTFLFVPLMSDTITKEIVNNLHYSQLRLGFLSQLFSSIPSLFGLYIYKLYRFVQCCTSLISSSSGASV